MVTCLAGTSKIACDRSHCPPSSGHCAMLLSGPLGGPHRWNTARTESPSQTTVTWWRTVPTVWFNSIDEAPLAELRTADLVSVASPPAGDEFVMTRSDGTPALVMSLC